MIAGACFIVGITLCAAAMTIGMLIIGRIAIGLGVGLGNQVCYHSMAAGSFHFMQSDIPQALVTSLQYELCIAHPWLNVQHAHT